jgi:phosphoglycerate dehydrogenase-like enzyme
MKVVITPHLLTDAYLRDLRASFPGVAFETAHSPDEQRRAIADAEVFCGPLSPELLAAARVLRWVHYPGTGVDWLLQIPELVDREIILTNARGPHAEPMADHLFAMLLSLTHRMRQLARDQEARRWEDRKYHDRMVQLTGKTMGILGLGGIGQAVARRAHGFGMKVVGVDVRAMAPPVGVDEVGGVDRLDDLLATSDVLVVAAPLTRETHNLLDRRRIEMIKPGAYAFVISRGGIVDEVALVDALRSGRLAGAGLDVFATEPLPADSPWWDLENVVLSPHVSAYSPEMLEGRRAIFKENVRRYLAGEPMLFVVDKQTGY